jgi:hypothetical protein
MTRTGWFLAAVCGVFWLNVSGCPGGDDDDTDCTGDDCDDFDDDDYVGDDDDATEGDDDDSVPGDDDDSATDDDDDSAGDDDDSAGDDDDDDSAGDDDDSAPADVHLLEIHLDNVTYAPVGYTYLDLPLAPLALGDAPAVVSAELPGTYVDGCAAQDTYLGFHYCYQAPGDMGGAALVDGRSGELVFAGEIIWDGQGQLLYPTPLDPAADLLATGPLTIAPENAEYALFGLEAPAVGDLALEAVREMDLVRNWVAWCTYDALVLLHPYADGGYLPGAADIVVVLVLC